MIIPALPDSFDFLGFAIKYYSVLILLSMIFGISFMCFIGKYFYKNIEVNTLLDMLPIVIISAILGARIYYVILSFDYYSKHLSEIFAIWNGGLSIHGAILGGFLAGYLYVKKHNLNLWYYADVFSYGVLLGQIVGRWGNYFNIEAFGKPCLNNILCMYVPLVKRPLDFANFEYFHPAFLYESVLNFLLLMILFFIIRPLFKNIDGFIFFAYLFGYSLVRFFIEQIRLDSALSVLNIHFPLIISVLLMILSLFMMICLVRKNLNK